MKIKIFNLLVLCSLLVLQAYGQVTIGSDKKPKEYEILKIDGVPQTGLRLPRLTTVERTALQTKMTGKESAKGLTIYNIDTKLIEFWNGSEWSQLGATITFANGLQTQGANKQVGGPLTKATTIDLAGKNLAMNIQAGGQLAAGDVLQATNTNLNLGSAAKPITFSVEDASQEKFLAISKANVVSIAANKAGTVNIDGTLIVSDTQVEIPETKTLQYKDGNETLPTGLSDLIMQSDANGNTSWTVLKPKTITETINVLGRTNGALFAVNTWTPVSETFTLSKGKWLIMGRYVSYTRNVTNGTSTAAGNYLSMLRVFRPVDNQTISVTASLPEKKSTSGAENSGAYASPNMVTYIDVAGADEVYRIDFYTAKANTHVPFASSWIGAAYFQAVRIHGDDIN